MWKPAGDDLGSRGDNFLVIRFWAHEMFKERVEKKLACMEHLPFTFQNDAVGGNISIQNSSEMTKIIVR